MSHDRCRARTRGGRRCGRRARPGSPTCWQHPAEVAPGPSCCVICAAPISAERPAAELPCCGQGRAVHHLCALKWFCQVETCLFCRAPVRTIDFCRGPGDLLCIMQARLRRMRFLQTLLRRVVGTALSARNDDDGNALRVDAEV